VQANQTQKKAELQLDGLLTSKKCDLPLPSEAKKIAKSPMGSVKKMPLPPSSDVKVRDLPNLK
jgi:hypothetical protein